MLFLFLFDAGGLYDLTLLSLFEKLGGSRYLVGDMCGGKLGYAAVDGLIEQFPCGDDVLREGAFGDLVLSEYLLLRLLHGGGDFGFGLNGGRTFEHLCGRLNVFGELFGDVFFDGFDGLFKGIERKELLFREVESGLVLRELIGESLSAIELAYGAHVADKADFDSLAVEVAFEVLDMYLQHFGIVAEGGTAAEIGDAGVCGAVYFDGDFIDAVLYGIFPFGIIYIDGGETQNARAAVGALHHLTFDKEIFAEELRGAPYVAAVEAGLDERGGNFFAIGHNVLDGHVPHAVFLVFGIVFER